MRDIVFATARSLAFLSRLPAPERAFRDAPPLGKDSYAFPLAGILVALPPALLILLAAPLGLSPTTTALFALGALVMVTGALHEDGLADIADGLGLRRPRDDALRIMRDSRIGAFGAAALILSLGARTSLLADLVAAGPARAALFVLLAAAGSRGAMAWLWSSLPPAAPGVGTAERAGQPSRGAGRGAAFVGAAVVAVPAILAGGPWAALVPLLLCAALVAGFRGFLRRRLGGVTGDALGAAQQLAEIALLLGFALAATGS